MVNIITQILLSCLDYYKEFHQTITMTTTIWMVFVHSEQSINLNHMWMRARIIIIVTKRPEPRNKILKFAQNHKSIKIPFAIYADIASLLEKNISVWYDPTKSLTSKWNKHTVIHCSHTLYLIKAKTNLSAEVETVWKSLVQIEKKEVLPLTKS